MKSFKRYERKSRFRISTSGGDELKVRFNEALVCINAGFKPPNGGPAVPTTVTPRPGQSLVANSPYFDRALPS